MPLLVDGSENCPGPRTKYASGRAVGDKLGAYTSTRTPPAPIGLGLSRRMDVPDRATRKRPAVAYYKPAGVEREVCT